MIGSAIAGAISMGVGVELKVPHGGIFVLPIPGAVTHLAAYALAIAAGAVVTCSSARSSADPPRPLSPLEDQ
jgi:PTS system fructose-specific IIC component